MNYEKALKKLEEIGQQHLLKYYDELSAKEQETLLSQIDETDFSVIRFMDAEEQASGRGTINPLAAMQLCEIAEKEQHFTQVGLEAIRRGKVGAVLLAGGMGTRLGSDSPKGVYNIGVTKELFIFECLIRNLMRVTDMAGAPIYLFVMTSDKNHEETVRFFETLSYVG